MDAEKILETVLDLERSRQLEQKLRIESESLLEGLRAITAAQTRDEVFQSLVQSLRPVLEFENAFILQMNNKGRMDVIASTSGRLDGTVWTPVSAFKRALKGKPVAVYDVNLLPEWQEQQASLKKNTLSALHIGLRGGRKDALLVVTHSAPKFFSPNHIKKASRFSPFASQALLTLELQQAVIQRDRFFQLSMDLMAIVDFDGNFSQYNENWNIILGYGRETMKNKSLFDFMHEEDRESMIATIQHIQKTGQKLFVEGRLRNNTGEYLWFSCSLGTYLDELLLYVIARDVTDRVVYEERLSYDARHDSLTGLYNRMEFMERTKSAFLRSSRYPDYRFALCYLDLNKFKSINDTHGHAYGDKVLITFADCLLQVVRETDVVARLGGDEFAILIEEIDSEEDVVRIARRIKEKTRHPYEIDGQMITISTSIGITTNNRQYKDIEDMLRKTDSAMYHAKADGNVDFIIYKEE